MTCAVNHFLIHAIDRIEHPAIISSVEIIAQIDLHFEV